MKDITEFINLDNNFGNEIKDGVNVTADIGNKSHSSLS